MLKLNPRPLTVALYSLAMFLLAAEPGLVHALPYQLNCLSMQQYANSLTWKGSKPKFVSFENSGGFENSGFDKWWYNEGVLKCDGYVEESSPLGIRVCTTSLYQQVKWVGNDPRQVYARDILPAGPLHYLNGQCRWRR